MFQLAQGRMGLVGGQKFTPAKLFAGGTVQGVWYDPSDASTLFSDTAGTTPSPTPGGGALSVVGLMLDKSQGLALGSELVTNGTFDTNINGWTTPANATNTQTWSSGALRLTRTSSTTASSAPITTVIGKTYQVSVSRTLVSGDLASGYIKIANTADASAAQIAAFTSSGVFTATATTTYVMPIIFPNAAVIDFDNISVKELAGNHAISYNTTTARPELSARVNLLTYSEQFDNAAWTKTSGGVGADPTITANTTVAPDGTTTADTYAQSTSSNARLFQTVTTVSGTVYTHSIYVKKNVGQWFRVLSLDTATQTNGFNAYFDLNNGVVGTTGTIGTGSVFTSASITAAANGFWRITITGSIAASSIQALFCYVAQADNNTARLDNGSVFLWGADLRPTNIGTSVPAYQRIADAYTYDSSGFPRYLVFNGVASGMYTPANLNLSGTDKATVFAGVRKISDAAAGVLAELSNNYNTNANTFLITIPTGANTQVTSSISNGSGAYNQAYYTDSAAPLSTVNSTAYNKALTADQVVFIRKNGADQTLTRTVNNNTGQTNFGTYPLNIGVRSATATPSIFFNGYLYSLIVVGAASTAAQISSTESWINTKEGGVY